MKMRKLIESIERDNKNSKQVWSLYYIGMNGREEPAVMIGTVSKLNQWAKKRNLKFRKDDSLFGGYYFDSESGDVWEADIVNERNQR